MGRANGCHYCPPRVMGVWLTMAIIALLLAGACRRTTPTLDVRPKSPESQTIDKDRVTIPPPVRVSRPRGPAYRLDNGLGSPIT